MPPERVLAFRGGAASPVLLLGLRSLFMPRAPDIVVWPHVSPAATPGFDPSATGARAARLREGTSPSSSRRYPSHV